MKVIEVYRAVMEAAVRNRDASKDQELDAPERNQALGASRELYWVAAMLEATEEVNPTN